MGSRAYSHGAWVEDGDTVVVPADVAALVAWVDGDLVRAQHAWEVEMKRPVTRDEVEQIVMAVAGVR